MCTCDDFIAAKITKKQIVDDCFLFLLLVPFFLQYLPLISEWVIVEIIIGFQCTKK